MPPQPTIRGSERHFLTMPISDKPLEGSEAASTRRIWEVEADALFIVLGVLLDRAELEAVFRDVEHETQSWTREDILLCDAVSRCSKECRFAQAVERLLDRQTHRERERVGACPMSELAGWWLGAQERVGGKQLAALLWSLARDGRWVIRGLVDRVRGDIWVRALRLLAARGAAGDAGSRSHAGRRALPS